VRPNKTSVYQPAPGAFNRQHPSCGDTLQDERKLFRVVLCIASQLCAIIKQTLREQFLQVNLWPVGLGFCVCYN